MEPKKLEELRLRRAMKSTKRKEQTLCDKCGHPIGRIFAAHKGKIYCESCWHQPA